MNNRFYIAWADIPNNLEVRGLEEVAPSLPVILSERILNADNGVLLGEVFVQVGELFVGEPLLGVTLGILEVEIVFLCVGLVELAGGNVHSDLDLASVSGLLNSLGDQVESLLGSLDIRSNTTLITDVTGRLAVLLLGQGLELLVNLGALAKTFAECGCGAVTVSFCFFTSIYGSLLRDNHEFLEGKTATSVGTTVQDVLERNGENIRLLSSGKVGDVSVERDTLLSSTSLGNGQGDTKDGVSAEVGLVGCAIELDEELINLALILNVDVLLDDGGSDSLVDVGDGLEDT